jgi:urea transport system permease protein
MPHTFKHFLATMALCLTAIAAQAAVDPALLQPLAGDDPDARIQAVGRIAALADGDAHKVLQALQDDALYATPAGGILVVDGEQAWDPATGKTLPLPEGADVIVVNNRLRAAVEEYTTAFTVQMSDCGAIRWEFRRSVS